MSDLAQLAQIGLVRTSGFSSWLTRVVTRSYYNHCVILYKPGVVVSAESSGVQEMPVEYFPDAVWSEFIYLPGQAEDAIEYTKKQLDKPYGVLTYLWIGVARLTRWKAPRWIEQRISDQKTMICSQLCDGALQAAGYHLFLDDRPPGAVTPGDFAKVFVDFGWSDKT